MSTAEQLFDAIAPQFTSNPNKSVYLELATGRVNACNFGTQANYATALWAAHIATMSLRSAGAVGAITSKKEGDLSIGFSGAVPGVSGALSSTSYGVMLLSLMKSKNVAVAVTGGCDNGCVASWPEMVK